MTAHDPAAPDGGSAPGAEFERLLAVMDRLRSPGGCPWDAAQTHESLLRYLVEESYEVVEAVEALEPSERRQGLDIPEHLRPLVHPHHVAPPALPLETQDAERPTLARLHL